MSDIQERIQRAEDAIRSAGMALPSGEVVEQRRVPMTIETRDTGDDGSWQFRGHAAVFDSDSEELGIFFPFIERIKRGAFKHNLKDDVRFLVNHDGLPLARTSAGTMTLSEDPKGLLVEADIAPTQVGRDLRTSIERGDVSQMSFMFTIAEYSWEEDLDPPVRTISRVGQIFDVSVVTFPAYRETDASVRSAEGDLSRDDLAALAWEIHRGERESTDEQRAEIDAALQNFSTVSPWIAERTLLAVAKEPELLAAIPGQRALVELTPDEQGAAFRRANRERRLRLREHALAA